MQRDMFNHPAFTKAQARALRRRQLWHASRLAVPDHNTWRAAWASIGEGIESILAREFGDLATT